MYAFCRIPKSRSTGGKMKRRMFVQALAAGAFLRADPCHSETAAPSGRLACGGHHVVWKPIVRPGLDVPALNGHTDTVPDIVGRIGGAISLAILTEGNHFPALLGDKILGPFRAWASRDPHYAGLDLGNIVVVTLPKPIIVAMLLKGAISLGNLTLEVSRASGFFPDIVMGGVAPLKELHTAGIVEDTALVFARNRGLSLLLRRGNPSAIHGLGDLARPEVRIIMAGANEPGARHQYIGALEAMLGRDVAHAVMARETVDFAGRLGIQHRDVPQAVTSGEADVGIIFHHLARYYANAYPELYEMLTVSGAEQFAGEIAMVPVMSPLRATAARAFAAYFLEVANAVYPRYGFATMSAAEFGAGVALGVN
jgi:hypothetical protein